MKKIPLFLFVILILAISSCSRLAMVTMGMKNPKLMTDKKILKWADKFDIPNNAVYKIDTGYMFDLISDHAETSPNSVKNHYQPLQVLYYDHEGDLISFHVNCYTGGFPNLNWNKDSAFVKFPPGGQAPLDTILPLTRHLSYIQPVGNSPQVDSNAEFDYTIIVHWGRFMNRQSKLLIEIVRKNLNNVEGKKVRVLFVNNDNVFGDSHIEY
ncbi:MAG: hypothetical protein IIA45_01960 [Bacteroidetes bacterium]|nr:hypothetical protein [Bacteroidota bacterium]